MADAEAERWIVSERENLLGSLGIIIVYYAPREDKTSHKCQFTQAVDWPILLPRSVYYFSTHRGRK